MICGNHLHDDMTPTLITPAIWQSLHFEWLWVYHGLVPVTERWSDEITVPAGWFFVESGTGRVRAGDREIAIKAGQGFFSAPGTRRQWFAAGTRLLSVGFCCQWPSGAPVFQAGLNMVATASRSASLLSATQTLFRSIHGRKCEVNYHEGILATAKSLADWCDHEAAFRQWFGEYVRTLRRLGIQAQPPTSVNECRLGTLMRALLEWPLDQSLKLTKLAEGTTLGSRRVHDLLRAHLGMTAQVWLEQRRLRSACDRLSGEKTSLKEIAFSLGFRHPPHFTAWFKRHTGMTPTAFRSGQGVAGA